MQTLLQIKFNTFCSQTHSGHYFIHLQLLLKTSGAGSCYFSISLMIFHALFSSDLPINYLVIYKTVHVNNNSLQFHLTQYNSFHCSSPKSDCLLIHKRNNRVGKFMCSIPFNKLSDTSTQFCCVDFCQISPNDMGHLYLKKPAFEGASGYKF